jgi:hypothetical protein
MNHSLLPTYTIRFDPIVRVLFRVVERARHELIHDGEESRAESVTTSTGSP